MELKNTHRSYTLILICCILSLVVLTQTGCGDIINSFTDELPEDIDEGADDSDDPNNPNLEIPGIQLTNPNYSLDTPFTVTERNIQIDWSVISDGSSIGDTYTYEYRYASPEENINDLSFIPIEGVTSISLPNLRETFNDELYTFQIHAIFSPTRDTTFTGQFSVNAFQNRGFLFNPSVINSNNDGSYSVKVFLDEIQESDDLTAFSLVLNYTGSYFDVSEEDITIYNSTDSFLYREGGEVISFTEVTSNTITIEVGIAGNNFTPFSGGGAICEILLTPTNVFPGSSSISISNASILKTSDGSDISILEYDDAEILQ